MVTFQNQVMGESFQCISCFWFVGRVSTGIACYAFPTGIPSEILMGTFDHRNLYPGDDGILWREDPEWAKPIESEEA